MAKLDTAKVDAALREIISGLDYDLHKELECSEEDGEDSYPGLAKDFIRYYEKP